MRSLHDDTGARPDRQASIAFASSEHPRHAFGRLARDQRSISAALAMHALPSACVALMLARRHEHLLRASEVLLPAHFMVPLRHAARVEARHEVFPGDMFPRMTSSHLAMEAPPHPIV